MLQTITLLIIVGTLDTTVSYEWEKITNKSRHKFLKRQRRFITICFMLYAVRLNPLLFLKLDTLKLWSICCHGNQLSKAVRAAEIRGQYVKMELIVFALVLVEKVNYGCISDSSFVYLLSCTLNLASRIDWTFMADTSWYAARDCPNLSMWLCCYDDPLLVHYSSTPG